jgi:hypothetical protein
MGAVTIYHQALAPPHAHDADPLAVQSIDNAERRPYEFTQPGLIELGDDSATLRELRHLIQARKDLMHQTLPNLRRRLKVADCRFGERDAADHLAEPERAPGILHGHFTAFFQVEKTRKDGPHELALFLRGLELNQSLHDRDAPTTARQ